MLQYAVKRLAGLVPTLLIVAVLVFGFVHLLPGDPARLAAGPDATPETVALVRPQPPISPDWTLASVAILSSTSCCMPRPSLPRR